MRKKQFEPLEIHDYKADTYPLPSHSHTYYELIYIHSGAGIHVLNSNQVDYEAGDLFLLCSDDEHHFQIRERTHFTFIKFTDSYFAGHKMHRPDALLVSTPESMMRNRLLKEVRLVLDEPCKTILRNTVENIVAYNCRKDIATSPLIFYQVLSIMGLIREAAAKMDIRVDNGHPEGEELIFFIHQNIYDPQQLQVKNVSARFNLSPTYFGEYFRQKFGVSYRNYLKQYRLKLIEKRLQVSSLTIKQIAEEFGFADESHLSHFFKRSRNMSPRNFRSGSDLSSYGKYP